jgi:tetratricopeptide (TPR) repeat protein
MSGKAEDDHQRRRREAKNRRTDNEIVGAARTIDERHATDMGALDRDLGVVPSEKYGGSPSYVSTMQEIKELYKEREYEAALVETNEALRSFPKSAKLLTMKGTLHQKLNNIELATAAYERAFALEPTKKLEAQIEHLRSVLSERASLGRKRETQQIQTNPEASAQFNASSTEGGLPK